MKLLDFNKLNCVTSNGSKYVAVIGNSGVGKSTLIHNISALSTSDSYSYASIDESTFHHPLLKFMFSDPARYSFPIQINFLIQRHLQLKKELEKGNVIIERSHLDDVIFLTTLKENGYVTNEQYEIYMKLFYNMSQSIPFPNVILFLDASPEESIFRITKREEAGSRIREFPSEIVKKEYITQWYAKYQALIQQIESEINQGKISGCKLEKISSDETPQSLVKTVYSKLIKLH